MRAEISTYGGKNQKVWDAAAGWVRLDTVQHWQLHIDGEYIADTAEPEHKALFERIAQRLNDPPVLHESVAITLRGLMEECRNRVGWDWENDHWLKEGRRVLTEAGWPELEHKGGKLLEVGAIRDCLVCAYPKPWGIYDEKTGATVCVDCRDAARQRPALVRAIRNYVAAMEELSNGVVGLDVPDAVGLGKRMSAARDDLSVYLASDKGGSNRVG